jgi:hypothetical protein
MAILSTPEMLVNCPLSKNLGATIRLEFHAVLRPVDYFTQAFPYKIGFRPDKLQLASKQDRRRGACPCHADWRRTTLSGTGGIRSFAVRMRVRARVAEAGL